MVIPSETAALLAIAMIFALSGFIAGFLSARAQYLQEESERDAYKLFYDAIIDQSVVDWTYAAEDEINPQKAVAKLVANHVAEAADPLVCENTAKLTARAEAAERKLKAVVYYANEVAERLCYCEYDRNHVLTLHCEHCEDAAAIRAIAENDA